MRRHRTVPFIAAGVLVLAACGSGDGSAGVAATDAPAATPASATTSPTATTGDPAASPTTAATDATVEESTDDAEAPAPTEAPAGTEAPAATDAPAATAAPDTTEAAPAGPVWPDDGCSADNSPTETDVADGPLPTLEVRAESADNPLPDLAVRRVNCNGGWVNLKNELPADKPLLVWFWAPH